MCSPPMISLKSTHNAGAANFRASKKSPKGESRPLKPYHGINRSGSENYALKRKKFPSCVRNTPVSSAGDIRNRYLNRLGIQKVTPSRPKTSLSPQTKPSILKETLKDDTAETSGVDCFSTETTSDSFYPTSSTSSLRSNKSRSVSFDESVTVRPIPRRDAYSDLMKQQIWSCRQEVHQNAARNSIEFAAENWDWRQVVGDEDMILTQMGKIHPVHYARQCNMQRNFLLVMAARRQGKSILTQTQDFQESSNQI